MANKREYNLRVIDDTVTVFRNGPHTALISNCSLLNSTISSIGSNILSIRNIDGIIMSFSLVENNESCFPKYVLLETNHKHDLTADLVKSFIISLLISE